MAFLLVTQGAVLNKFRLMFARKKFPKECKKNTNLRLVIEWSKCTCWMLCGSRRDSQWIEWNWNVGKKRVNKNSASIFTDRCSYMFQQSQWILISDCVMNSPILNTKCYMSRTIHFRPFFPWVCICWIHWWEAREKGTRKNSNAKFTNFSTFWRACHINRWS